MKVLESPTARVLLDLCAKGSARDWHGFVGSGASRWLQSKELLEVESDLDLSAPYRPMNISFPKLALEYFMITGAQVDQEIIDEPQLPLMILQVDGTGSMYRVVWESVKDDRPPLELYIHLISHASRCTGPGSVVYRCQPQNIIALAGLLPHQDEILMRELNLGYAAMRNILPEGVAVLDWSMPIPIHIGMPMTEPMLQDMKKFVGHIGEKISNHEVVVLIGEGIICTSDNVQVVFGITCSTERAAAIRLKMLAADRD